MARRRKDDGRNPPRAPAPPPRPGIDTIGLATLAGIIAVLMISFANMRSIDRVFGDLDDRLDDIEARIGQAPAVQAQVQQQPAEPTPPRRRGPDPDEVYEVQTAGAPARGPAGAPVVIAEFSDFQ